MPRLAVLYDPQADTWLRFTQPLEELEVYALDEVLPALEHIEQRVKQEGLFAAGFVSYEAAPACDEALQTHTPGELPLLHFGLFSAVERIDLPVPDKAPEFPFWKPQTNASEFATKVDTIREAIARGETYQVNLTFPLLSDGPSDAWSFFLQLVQGQQAKGAGYLQTEHWAICSVSPELFFSREDDRLSMRPMKGTAPRGRTLAEDCQQAEKLQHSVKNRAENIMILDMVRNDLGRLAPPGEVQTEEICTLEKYPTIWQLTSTASAHSKASLAETFKALFPCASITGAPKAQTMQIIKSVETGPRGIYTGTFGWLEPEGRAHFNVAIRTALVDLKRKHATYGIGAGITWDSESADEYQECLDKAAVLSRPVGDFALIETLRWTPDKGYFLLAEHLDRLQDSAEYFDFVYERHQITRFLKKLSREFPSLPQRVRFLLHRNGQQDATFREIDPETKSTVKIDLATEPVDSHNVRLFHKTTQRQIYEKALAAKPEAEEVVLWNEQGEITECCTANLVVERSGEFVTPPVSCGLLPGTYREFLLKRGILTEQVITPDDLHNSSSIYLINAVRKWRKATFHR